jgi:hypothetical protein
MDEAIIARWNERVALGDGRQRGEGRAMLSGSIYPHYAIVGFLVGALVAPPGTLRRGRGLQDHSQHPRRSLLPASCSAFGY